MMENSKNQAIGLDQLAAGLAQGLDGFDQERAAALTDLADAREARAAVLAREKERLGRKLGPSHPRVLAIAGELDVNDALVRDLHLEAETAAMPDSVPAADRWLVHGHVRDAAGQGLAGLTVAPYDADGGWDRDRGRGCTDPTGYFTFSTRVSDVGERFLHVLNQAGAPLLVDDLPLVPRPWTSVYRALTLAEGAAPCVPPIKPGGDGQLIPGGWVVHGRVTDARGQGISGLMVTVYDQDLFFDDRLGQAETGADGAYLLSYRSEDFRDLFERKPDLYLDVRTPDGKVLYSSKRGIRYEAGRVEIIDVSLAGRKSAAD